MKKLLCLIITVPLIVLTLFVSAVQAGTLLESGFNSSPDAARPWVYWYWMNGNVSTDGIKADLKAMQDVGIGGVLLFDVGLHPAGPVVNRTKEWYELVHLAVSEAAKRNIKVSFHCPGWSASGGPWITPEYGMQELVWSETYTDGGKEFSQVLPQPAARLDYYKDVAVIAFPTIGGDRSNLQALKPVFKDPNGNVLNVDCLLDGNPDSDVTLSSQLDIDFNELVELRSIYIRARHDFSAKLLVWNPEKNDYTLAAEFQTYIVGPFSSYSSGTGFDAVKSRRFRIIFPNRDKVALQTIDLRGSFRLPNWPNKAGFACEPIVPGIAEQQAGSEQAVALDKIIDLTAQVDKDGKLNWTVPQGNWTIIRIGYTPTAIKIFPAPAGGDGLECDKLSKEAADFHYDKTITPVLKDLGPDLVKQALAYYHVDSYEAGWQNWTVKFREEFQTRRGYDLIKYFPAITGRIVGNQATTEQFLWDFRQTITDLFADNHYGQLAKRCHEDGLQFSTEPYGGQFENLQIGGRADHPMAEFWLPGNPQGKKYNFQAVSAAHIYDRKIVSAESFTSDAGGGEKWTNHPYTIKALGDLVYCSGINRYVVHVFAHQPFMDEHLKPGLTCGWNGIHYDRNNTWWLQGKAWVDYTTRCQYMLQQGLHVADVLYLQGSEAITTYASAADQLKYGNIPLPEGYDSDACNEEVLLRLAVKNGNIVLPHGKMYRYLVLPDYGFLTLAASKKIEQLVKDGATVIGPRILQSPSFSDVSHDTQTIGKISDELWGADKSVTGIRNVAKGRIITGMDFPAIFKADKLATDFCFDETSRLKLHYIHRQTTTEDWYFVANASRVPGWVTCTFRISDKTPQFWCPDTGEIKDCAVFSKDADTIKIPIYFDSSGSVFVVFKNQSKKVNQVVSVTKDGRDVFANPNDSHKNVNIINNFTMALWVKPTTKITLPDETTSGVSWNGKQNWAVFPSPGHVFYGDDHAGAGISVGKNGICVMVHWAFNVPAVLVYKFPSPITDWTHIAIVYADGKPSLYVNRKLVRTGLAVDKKVHPSVDVQSEQDYAMFRGLTAKLKQFERALNDSDLISLVNDKAGLSEIKKAQSAPVTPDIEFAKTDSKTNATIWKAGRYELALNNGKKKTLNVPSITEPVVLGNSWKVCFPKGWGAPAEVNFPKLISWSESKNVGIKYFSGSAIYYGNFTVPAGVIKKGRGLYLDLGQVDTFAELKVNGKDFGILWKPPFRVNVTSILKTGDNKIEVRITNLWPNRMIGDEQFPSDVNYGGPWPQWLYSHTPRPEPRRMTFSAFYAWKKEDQLLSSGLIGPVRILITEEKQF